MLFCPLTLLLYLHFARADAGSDQSATIEQQDYYVCPTLDTANRTLLELPFSSPSIPINAPYSVFSCLYLTTESREPLTAHTCHYYKDGGAYALGSMGSSCPPRASFEVAGSDKEKTKEAETGVPHTHSGSMKDVLPWIEHGDIMMWFKDHYRGTE